MAKKQNTAEKNKGGRPKVIMDVRDQYTEEVLKERDKQNALIKKKVSTAVKKFMKSAREFAMERAGVDYVPPEWELSLFMLQTYLSQFLELTYKVDDLPSLCITGRYGETPHPLLAVRDKAAMRLEATLKEMGMTMKAAKAVGALKEEEPKEEESPLDNFLKGSNA